MDSGRVDSGEGDSGQADASSRDALDSWAPDADRRDRGPADSGDDLDGRADDGRADDGRADDGRADDGRADDGRADDGSGASTDLSQGDAVSSNAVVFGKVTSAVAPLLDGRGTLYVGLYNAAFPPPGLPPILQSITVVDLSVVGASTTYEMFGTPAPGDYLLYAFLDDNSNVFPLFLAPDVGDLVVASAVPVTIKQGQALKQDLVLSTAFGGLVDGGVGDTSGVGGIQGEIRSTAIPTLDGKGAISIRVRDKPNGAVVGQTAVLGADLSSPFARYQFFVGNVPAGQFFLEVFLDDSDNFLFVQVADKGDIIHSKPIPVRVQRGSINRVDVTLDAVQP